LLLRDASMLSRILRMYRGGLSRIRDLDARGLPSPSVARHINREGGCYAMGTRSRPGCVSWLL
jgi:hypothetical protein